MAHRRYIIGQSKTGKTSLLKQLIEADSHQTICIFDTKGDLNVPHDILFDPAKTRWNPLAEPIERNIAPQLFARTIEDVVRGKGSDDKPLWVMNMGMNLKFLASALIDNRRNLTDIPEFLLEQSSRQTLSFPDKLTDRYWSFFEEMSAREQMAHTTSTFNLFATLLMDARVRRMFSVNRIKCEEGKSGLSLRAAQHKTMLVRLPVSEYGRETVSIIGSLVLSYLHHLIPTCAIYVEDCNLFASGTLTEILSGGVGSLTLSHQYIDQLDPTLFSAIQGNCSQQFIFRVSSKDAEALAHKLPPMSPKTSLDELHNFKYRVIPFKNTTDGITVPLEKNNEGSD